MAARCLPILTYHSLDEAGSVLSTAPSVFAEHMRLLRAMGARGLSLAAAVAGIGARPEPERVVAITFDDGFESVYRHAFPLLQEHGFAATVFLVTDHCLIDGAGDHGGSRSHLRWEQVREMAGAGIEIGAHTQSHPDLTRLTRAAALAEIAGSKDAIGQRLGRAPDTFAYPYGAYDDAVRELAAAHFRLACSTRLDFAGPASDPHALPRLDAYYLRAPRLFARLFSPELRAYLLARRALRALRAQVDRRRASGGRAA